MKLLKNIVEFFSNLFSIFKKKPKIVEIDVNTDTTPTGPVFEGHTECSPRIADKDEFDELESVIHSIKPSLRKSATTQHIIPICFHILHKGEAYGVGTNISDQQIHSAVNALNKDYSKELNSTGDGIGVETPFRFVLMNKDDAGNPTTGIYRVNGSARSAIYDASGARNSGPGESQNEFKNWSRQNNQWVYNVWLYLK